MFSRNRRRNTRQPRASRGKSRVSTNLDRTLILSKSRRRNTFSGARHTPENTETQIFVCLSIAWRADNAISYRDVCRAWQILRLCQAYLFLTFQRGFTHTQANFQMRSMGIFGVFLLFLTEIRINALFWDSDAPVAFSALPVNRSDAFKKERYRLKSAPIGHRFDENRTIR